MQERDSPDPGTSEVVQLLHQRLEGTPDQNKLGLAVEGGGMRGVVSGAMLIALRDQGYADLFDGYYGTSSGSMNMAYFLTGHGWDALSVYYDHLVSSDFVSASRLLRGRPIMDMDYLYEVVMTNRIPLDYRAVLNTGKRFCVSLTNVDRQQAEIRCDFESPLELKALLRGGATLPIIAGRPYVVDGTRYLDGGALYPAPFYAALADGCTHVLSIGTRNWGPQRLKLSWWQHVLSMQLDRWSPGLGDVYKKVNLESYPVRAKLRSGEQQIEGGRVFHLRTPPDTHEVTRMTMDRGILLDAARHAYQLVQQTLTPGEPTVAYFSMV